MSENNASVPGTFCWADLGTSDAEAAKTFYSRLFGWSIFETGAGETAYTMFQIDGKDVVAAYSLNEEQRAQGIPPHWVPYVSVENAEESAAKAWELGGKLLLGAFDVEGHGRMALIQDPTGATFAVWQPL
jgi:predicted enzyme related to lactoylglutathione lyase